MRQAIIEIIVGIFIIVVILALIFLAVKVSDLANYSGGSTYSVTADFNNIGDLKVRAPVSIAGVNVGQVSKVTLNPERFQAVVTMSILSKYKTIPENSTANIFTEGLLGANYISLTPGYSDENLKNGSVIQNTNSALILQNLIGQLLFSLKGGGDKNSSASTAKTGGIKSTSNPISGVNTNLGLGK